MSSTTKWVIAILVVIAIVLGLWWGGLLGNGKPADNGQSAAAVTAGAAPLDVSDATIAQEAAAIDAQMNVAGNQMAVFGKTPSAAAADLLAGQLGSTAALMNKLSSRFQTRVSGLKGVGIDTNALQAAVSDLNLQLSYAVSEIGLGGQAAASVKPDNGDKTQQNNNKVALQQAVIELQKSQSYLQAAQKDIKTVIDGFKTASAR